jgi:hypothetical protein
MKLSGFRKLISEAVAFSLTPSQISILRTDFHEIDTDRSGTISFSGIYIYVCIYMYVYMYMYIFIYINVQIYI